MGTVHLGKMCVYSHTIDGDTIYIGKGGTQRPYEFRYRTKRWKDIVGEKPFDVEILGWFDTDREAREFEKKKIQELNPIGNAIHTAHYQAVRTKKAKPLSMDFHIKVTANEYAAIIAKYESTMATESWGALSQFIRSTLLKAIR